MTDDDLLCAMAPVAPVPPPPLRWLPEPPSPDATWGVWDLADLRWVATGAADEREAFGLLIAADSLHQGELALAVGVPPFPPEQTVRPHRVDPTARRTGWPRFEEGATVGKDGRLRRKEPCEECEDGDCPTCGSSCSDCYGDGWVWVDVELERGRPARVDVPPGQGVLVA